MSTNRLTRRFAQAGAVIVASGTAALLLGGGVASAHVTARVIGETAQQGGFTKITFRVPNEDSTAGTIKLELKLPSDTPISSLRTKPVPGWTAQVTKAKLATPVVVEGAEITEAVSTVTWTAAAGVRIGPNEFEEFEVSGGPLPTNTDKLIIPAVQTYDNGKVVSWDAPPPAAGAEEPEHPAPVVALAAAAAEGAESAHGGAAAAGNTENQPVENAASTISTDSSDMTARWLGGIGLALGALGVGFGIGATMRARRAVSAPQGGDS